MKTVVGLMSGTSVDGIDGVIMQFSGNAIVRWKLLGSKCLRWPDEARAAILDACRSDYPVSLVTVLNYALGEYFGEAVCQLCNEFDVPLSAIDAIASHGQTIWHQPTALPSAGTMSRGTLQLGEAGVIARITGRPVISDFRAGDMAVGGQGAPLVPWWDWRIMRHRTETRVIQNIGGIANLTYLPAGRDVDQVMAFDTGPGNMVIDQLMALLTDGKQTYDEGGSFAARGTVQLELLTTLLMHPFFGQPPPRSTGREMFGADYAANVLSTARTRGISEQDLMATVTELTVESIAGCYENLLPAAAHGATVILSGGGVRNGYMVDRLRKRLPHNRVTTHEEWSIPDDFREAMAFALLGYERLMNRCSNVPAATGANLRVSLGKVTLPPETPTNREAV